jgi:hypothetical protein
MTRCSMMYKGLITERIRQDRAIQTTANTQQLQTEQTETRSQTFQLDRKPHAYKLASNTKMKEYTV